ncbi:hypothetical protein BX600DRAFT_311912 [Xylariales sp. PMI_506]|nr:hypothetical protein BX600DRAFT_311912 [Xylariales sp. PMI_506]
MTSPEPFFSRRIVSCRSVPPLLSTNSISVIGVTSLRNVTWKLLLCLVVLILVLFFPMVRGLYKFPPSVFILVILFSLKEGFFLTTGYATEEIRGDIKIFPPTLLGSRYKKMLRRQETSLRTNFDEYRKAENSISGIWQLHLQFTYYTLGALIETMKYGSLSQSSSQF